MLVTGARFHAGYEIYEHCLVAELRGLSDEKIATIVAGQRPPDLTRQEALAYDIASARVGGSSMPGRFRVTLLHMRAVIEIPLPQIAVDPGVNRRLVPRLNSARQSKMLDGSAGSGTNDFDRRNCLLPCPLRDLGLMAPAIKDASDCDGDCHGGRYEPGPSQARIEETPR